MQVDWKVVSKSPGYRSLKAAYCYDVQKDHHEAIKFRRRKPIRDKKEFRRYFKRAIALTMKCAHKYKIPLDVAFNLLEENRDYWWLNFYQDHSVDRVLSKASVS